MAQQIDLLKSLPVPKRNLSARNEQRDEKVIEIAKKFGGDYFDGDRKFGYGGYKYDGRWLPVARDFIEYFKLTPGMKVLDVGCAKGFLVKDFLTICPGLEVFGIDISSYALQKCEPEVVGRLHLGNALSLPFPNQSFDLVLSLNTIHNFDRTGAITALSEVQRVSRGRSFVQVDSYYSPEQKSVFENWVLTAKFHDYPEGWIKVFEEAGYTGDYNWTIID